MQFYKLNNFRDASKYHGIKKGAPIIILNPEESDSEDEDALSTNMRRLSIGVRYKPSSRHFD